MTEPNAKQQTLAEKLASINLRGATGAEAPDLQTELLAQIFRVLPLREAPDDTGADARAAAALAALAGLKPQDEIDGMLAVQMVSLHFVAMESLRGVTVGRTPEKQDLSVRHVTKLMTVFLRQMEAFDRRRGKGTQNVTVETMNVHPGAQAVVGMLTTAAAQVSPPVDEGAPVPALTHQPVMPMRLNAGGASANGKQRRHSSAADALLPKQVNRRG